MPTSGSTTWELTRDQLVSAAMRKLGALGEGQTPSTEEYTIGGEALNGIMAAFQTFGMPLWERREFDIDLVNNQAVYPTTPFMLKLHRAYLRNISTGQQTEMEIKSEYEWQSIRSNLTSSYPVFVSYTPRVGTGELKVWPTPNLTADTTYSIRCIGQAAFEDVNASGHTLDFPKEWHNAIIYELACVLAPEFGASAQEKMDLRIDAKKYLEYARDFGVEETSMYFQVERW